MTTNMLEVIKNSDDEELKKELEDLLWTPKTKR